MWGPDLQSASFYDRTARFAPWLDRVTALVDGVDPAAERRWLLDRLGIEPDHRVLEVAVGTGANGRLLDGRLGLGGAFVGADVSRAALRQCRRRLRPLECRSLPVAATAARLPFGADSFDAVFHFGGINAFEDRAGAVAEMVRVAKPEATVAISDKSLPPDRPRSLRQRALLRLKPRLARPPPVDLVPLPREAVDLAWFWGGAAYCLSFAAPERTGAEAAPDA